MIITFTPNPSLDRTYAAPTLELGEINRARTTRVDAGGKGLNVTRALTAAGTPSTAVFPAGGPDGDRLVVELRAHQVPAHPVPVAADTRSNVTLVDDAGTTTKINAPGDPLPAAGLTALLDALRQEITAATAAGAAPVVVGAGSLPTGAGDDLYARVAALCAGLGATMVLDTSGAPLARAVAAGGLALVKPNDAELAELTGRELRTVGHVIDAAATLIDAGTRDVLVSLGAHGLLLVRRAPGGAVPTAPGGVVPTVPVAPDGAVPSTPDRAAGLRAWWAGGPALVPRSTVGAGDCTLAGYLAATYDDAATHGTAPSGAGAPRDDERTLRALRHAAAWGRAAVLLPGSAVPTPADLRLDDVRTVVDPPRDTPLDAL